MGSAAQVPPRRINVTDLTPQNAWSRYQRARERRSVWEGLWQECYDFALPSRDTAISSSTAGARRWDRIFDGTAPDAVDQLAASMMANLTPPWARWFGFAAGPDINAEERAAVGAGLERTNSVMQSHFDRSNFAVEMHQCYLDLVTAGTASLLFEEAASGDASAFRFTAVPLSQIVLEEGPTGRLDVSFRRNDFTVAQLLARFPAARGIAQLVKKDRSGDADVRVSVLEAVVPDGGVYSYLAVTESDIAGTGEPTVLAQGRFSSSPFINFRWLKAPGEIYGRSPVMKALPDIKTANKVVELVLKNASIAVTGIWQADDDGVINPATIKLVPGTIIPKAVGSAGLTPLATPGRFDVSELVLDQLRERIRKALFVDFLGQVNGPKMTATEVLERAAQMARVLGATYGRLQTELLSPLVSRGRSILARRGEIPDLPLDHRIVALEYKSPQARFQAQQDVQNTLIWLDSVRSLGDVAISAVDLAATTRWLGRTLGVPGELMRDVPVGEPPVAEIGRTASHEGGNNPGLPTTEDIAALLSRVLR
ncbi:MAG: head-tail connector protein [Rhodospirillales bacterium]|nr:head-tail connector protein [Rhodospirillales bacterium]